MVFLYWRGARDLLRAVVSSPVGCRSWFLVLGPWFWQNHPLRSMAIFI